MKCTQECRPSGGESLSSKAAGTCSSIGMQAPHENPVDKHGTLFIVCSIIRIHDEQFEKFHHARPKIYWRRSLTIPEM
jgi:alpha-D-ribose 1-methylphosphonate 5-triphosphate diphosphatase PhnM